MQAKARQMAVERAARLKETAARNAAARVQQQAEIPGERQRIEHGLRIMKAERVVDLLLDNLNTMEGLRHAAALITVSSMPAPQTRHCVRCDKSYDPQYAEARVCRMLHPDQKVRQEWDGSKISWYNCRRCNGNFDGHNKSDCDDEWCFVGAHTADAELVKDEGWNDDTW
eukprot:INCI7322.1.p1 GENE.INCI7322.1~~INCI7322.1.p1  ORF type:complete len:170 (+),score=35.29 INCI7322.1:117-626(+)